MHFKWNYEPPTSDRTAAAKELAEKIGMSPILADLLIQRGIKTESAAKRFFRPMLNKVRSPRDSSRVTKEHKRNRPLCQ